MRATSAYRGVKLLGLHYKHLFVTGQGSPYGRFRRALDRQNVLEALSSAAEMRSVALSDALELLLLIATKDAGKFGRAALRWHARYCRELRVFDLRARPRTR
jgi:hypothetical protein